MKNARLCLNMIVKNEMANLGRCLGAVADYIDCWAVADTGSTDGTQDFVRSFFAARSLPGELHNFPFRNFEQARNDALDAACASPLDYDYLLFADADMELVVEDGDFRARLEAPGYRLVQRADSGLTYWNTRLVRRDVGARYHGVTHEYVDVPGGVQELRGVWYKDHASGSNRVDKFERDIRLLLEGLEQEPENRRYWFYLAQSYRDAGQPAKAAEAYARRAAMGGWDEEAWSARHQQARCLRKLGDEGGFLREALTAFNQRPQRAEPLYDLARSYRERGMNDASVLFSEAGLAMPRPEQDILFLEDSVYSVGLREEYSIAANYSRDPARKDRGFAACNWLALNREIPARSRALAFSNLFFYARPASAMMASFNARAIGFTPPDGYRPLNPSVARRDEEILLTLRSVNYVITEKTLRYERPSGEPFHTRNFLLRLSDELEVEAASEILPPADLPDPMHRGSRGFEDLRLFAWRGSLWCSGSLRELTPQGRYEQVLARIDESGPGQSRLADWRVLRPEGPRKHEKNWMPRVSGETLDFIYSCDPSRVVDDHGRTMASTTPAITAGLFRGGTQAIAFDGGWLAAIHEVQLRSANKQRFYLHRFVWFDETDRLRGVSRPFFLNRKGVEFAAGLAWHPDGRRLVISYGVADSEAWIASFDSGDVRGVLEDADNLPSGLPKTSLGSCEDAQPPESSAAGPLGGDPEAVAMQQPSSVVPNSEASSLPEAALRGAAPGERKKARHTLRSVEAHKPEVDPNASVKERFLSIAPFLEFADSPSRRRDLSRAFDERIANCMNVGDNGPLPQIHCFYEVMSETARHETLIASTASMRAAGHPVRVWTYSPEKLAFLVPHGIEVEAADDVMPRGLFERIVAGSEIRYFSDIFRYAALYEHGGLWMDSDVVLLRPFAFHGGHFFNLQWRSGSTSEHFVCGNVMFAERYSRHLRALYERSINCFFGAPGHVFGDVGPKLLSDYIGSPAGAELRDGLFSPMFFNSIDWTESDRFEEPIAALSDYLNDERVFGIHLWTARNTAGAHDSQASLASMLHDPLGSFPSLTRLADRFGTDKNRHTGNRHCYARVYDGLLSSRRFSLKRLMEIGLHRGPAEDRRSQMPSVDLWHAYFPFSHVIGVDRDDFSRLDNARFTSFACDQSKREELRALAARLGPGSLDVIIDDGSHASYDQQLTLRELFPLLADGGWYFIEDLDWQPPGEDVREITLTKTLLQEIQLFGNARCVDPLGVSDMSEQIAEILFFDSHYELNRAKLLGGLAAIRKRGGAGLVR